MISRSFGKEQLYLQYFFKKQIRYTVYLHWKELHSSYMIVLICWFKPLVLPKHTVKLQKHSLYTCTPAGISACSPVAKHCTVSLTAVFSVVMQCSSPHEHCVMTVKTSVRETKHCMNTVILSFSQWCIKLFQILVLGIIFTLQLIICYTYYRAFENHDCYPYYWLIKMIFFTSVIITKKW